MLAFRDRQLFALVQFKTRAGVIYDIHAIADPAKLAVVQLQFDRDAARKKTGLISDEDE